MRNTETIRKQQSDTNKQLAEKIAWTKLYLKLRPQWQVKTLKLKLQWDATFLNVKIYKDLKLKRSPRSNEHGGSGIPPHTAGGTKSRSVSLSRKQFGSNCKNFKVCILWCGAPLVENISSGNYQGHTQRYMCKNTHCSITHNKK